MVQDTVAHGTRNTIMHWLDLRTPLLSNVSPTFPPALHEPGPVVNALTDSRERKANVACRVIFMFEVVWRFCSEKI